MVQDLNSPYLEEEFRVRARRGWGIRAMFYKPVQSIADSASVLHLLSWALLILGMKTGRDDWELCSQSSRFSAMPIPVIYRCNSLE
jgi:hypothetical protein